MLLNSLYKASITLIPKAEKEKEEREGGRGGEEKKKRCSII